MRDQNGRWLLVGSLAVPMLIAALFAPTLLWLVRSWLVHPYYSHGLLMPLAAGWFAWRERGAFTTGAPHNAGLVVMAAGVGLHLAALRWAAHPLSAAALLVVLLGLALLYGGRPAVSAASFPVALLGLAIPLPMVERLAPPLAALVARWAVLAAGSIGTGVVQVGAQLIVGDGTFTVGAPCSGLRSIVALATLAVVIAGATDGPRRGRIALVALAVPVALLANWLRLTGFLWLADVADAERALAVYHALSSPVLFVAATIGLLAVATALGCHVRPRA